VDRAGSVRRSNTSAQRRWPTWDLLCGSVDRHHPLYRFLCEWSATESELAMLAEQPVPPDVIGINYYLTSDRGLDHRLEGYPAAAIGGNGRETYADVELVRVADGGSVGHTAHLLDVWERYRRTVALVTAQCGHYEPGAYHVRSPTPRATATAHIICGPIWTNRTGTRLTQEPARRNSGSPKCPVALEGRAPRTPSPYQPRTSNHKVPCTRVGELCELLKPAISPRLLTSIAKLVLPPSSVPRSIT
jgi:hypothetical protein